MAQSSYNETIGPLSTYQGKDIIGINGPSKDMVSSRNKTSTSYVKVKRADGQIIIWKLKNLNSYPDDHPFIERETLLNPSNIRAAGSYVSHIEIKYGGRQTVILNYDIASKKPYPNLYNHTTLT